VYSRALSRLAPLPKRSKVRLSSPVGFDLPVWRNGCTGLIRANST